MTKPRPRVAVGAGEGVGKEYIKGLRSDAKGFLWAVNYSETGEGNNPIDPELAMKIDVATLSVVGSYDGLDRPYTYSDFTGNALFNVSCVAPQ